LLEELNRDEEFYKIAEKVYLEVMGADEPEEGEEYILDFGGEWEV
jgi:hypothetical protein